MSFWTKVFGGTEIKEMPRDPQFEAYNSALANSDPGLGASGKYYKSILKRLGRGDDVSNFGEFNAIRQAGAAERQGIEEGYMTGANALLAQSGGPQAALLQRAKEMAVDRQREREGRSLVDATTNLSREAAAGFEDARQFRRNLEFQGKNAAAGNQLNYMRYLRQLVQNPGLLNTLSNMAQGAGSFMTGMGALPGGG